MAEQFATAEVCEHIAQGCNIAALYHSISFESCGALIAVVFSQ